jgi:HK97 gp10 family phage protein
MSVIRGRPSGTYFKGYLEGGPELAKKLAALGKGLRDELLVEATTAGAEVIAEEWRAQARSRYGQGPGTAHFPDAIGIRARPGKNGATAYVGLPNPVPQEPGEAHPREYGPALEFGKSHAPAQPTLRPAFDASKGKALDALGKKIWELIERVV